MRSIDVAKYPRRLVRAANGDPLVSEPRVVSSQRLREGWPPISEDEIELPSGARRRWIRMHFGTSAAVLPLTKEREIVLTREYRHGLGRVAFTLPGGSAKDGESAEACARRELLEETGYQAARLLEMYAGNNLTAYLEGTLHLFLAKDCRATDRRPDPDEIQGIERMSVTQAWPALGRGNSSPQSSHWRSSWQTPAGGSSDSQRTAVGTVGDAAPDAGTRTIRRVGTDPASGENRRFPGEDAWGRI